MENSCATLPIEKKNKQISKKIRVAFFLGPRKSSSTMTLGAIWENFGHIKTWLQQRGFDVDAVHKHGEIRRRKDSSFHDIGTLSFSPSCTPCAMWEAASCGNIEVCQWLHYHISSSRATVRSCDRHGQSAMFIACARGH